MLLTEMLVRLNSFDQICALRSITAHLGHDPLQADEAVYSSTARRDPDVLDFLRDMSSSTTTTLEFLTSTQADP